MTYSSQPFSARFQIMGDIAEEAFVRLRNGRVHQSGMKRPDFSMKGMRRLLRRIPDFVVPDDGGKFVECIGMGRDNRSKLVLDKIEALFGWQVIAPVDIFVYDSHRNVWYQAPLDEWFEAAVQYGEYGEFKSDGNRHLLLHARHFPTDPQPFEEAA